MRALWMTLWCSGLEKGLPFGASSSGSRVCASGFRTEGFGAQDVGPRSWTPRVSFIQGAKYVWVP